MDRSKPTPEQLEALRDFAAKAGRTWKSQLNHCWVTGYYPPNVHGSELQRIRNAYGPSWLVRFKLNGVKYAVHTDAGIIAFDCTLDKAREIAGRITHGTAVICTTSGTVVEKVR